MSFDSICRQFNCQKCSSYEECGGCLKNCGKPFNGLCLASEIIKERGYEGYQIFKSKIIDEINNLGIKDLKVYDLNLLSGSYVNLEYELENGSKVKLLKDNDVYLGQQIERENNERCYGVVVTFKYLLVCEYGCKGRNPEIILYRKLNY